MDNQNQPEKPEKKPKIAKSPERRGPPLGNNVIWYLLGIGVTILLVVGWLHQDSAYELSYSDLVNLVEADRPSSSDHTVIIHESTKPGSVGVRYHDPSEIKIGQYEITGKVFREAPAGAGAESSAAPSGGSATTERGQQVAFRTNRDPLNNAAAQDLQAALKESKIPYDNVEGPSPLKGYLPMLVLTGLLIVVFFFMLRRLGGAGSPMAFGRSRGKMYAQEDIGITFEDVAGIDEAVEELREVVEQFCDALPRSALFGPLFTRR